MPEGRVVCDDTTRGRPNFFLAMGLELWSYSALLGAVTRQISAKVSAKRRILSASTYHEDAQVSLQFSGLDDVRTRPLT